MQRKTQSAAETKERFADALRRVEAGDRILITRYGKPVAALVGPEDLAQVERLRATRPQQGLAGLLGRWDDSDEFAQELDRVVSQRPPLRASVKLD